MYDEVIIYYFSGTGNAEYAALWVGNEAKKAGVDYRIINIAKMKDKKIRTPTSNALIGFISPTHGFHFPLIMRKFIKSYPRSNNCSAFIMNTRAGTRIRKTIIGGLSGILHFWSSALLILKGFKIVGLFPVDLPSNWISVHPAFKKKGTDVIYTHVEPKVRQFADSILNGDRNYKALSPRNMILDIMIAPISIAYILVGKYFFAKSFIASSDCDKCNICEKNCPVNAIKEIDGRKFWTSRCESCMQCMNTCPRQAIETAHGFLFLIWIITSAVNNFTINQLLKFPTCQSWHWLQNTTTMLWIKLILVFPFLFLGYRLMHWLLKFSFFERLVVFTSLTKLKFWGRYKAPKKCG